MEIAILYNLTYCVYFFRGLEYFIERYPEDVRSSQDGDGNTALHSAVANNHLDIVCLLANSVGLPDSFTYLTIICDSHCHMMCCVI